MKGTRRADIKPGIDVMVELAEHKHTGRLTKGIVKEIITSSPNHPHGIKVILESGMIGRIKEII
ncbi:MAG TPA: YwbE family protein [Bacteroidales bacterium]|nr:YwbE family protein [Bacteroidales bacterium]